MPRREHETQTTVSRVDPLVGTIFDNRFRVEERLAAGGFGAIYRATHVKSGHEIALKVLLPALAQDLGVVARFRREGAAMTTLRSPHTVTAYELGETADRTLFIVMELLRGESLFDRYQAGGPLEWRRVVKIAMAVCDSVAEAHAQGIVHRDLKPTNIHLEQHGDDPDFVKVLDFGIAKIVGGGASGLDASDITNAGQMIGTLDYMSPEQMVGGAVTGQSDLYTLGIVMYEVIAGCRPFPEAATASAALGAMLKTTPQSLYLRAPVPQELDRIVMRCLAREPRQRYATVEELRADLERVLGEPAANARTVTVVSHNLDGDQTTVTPPPENLLASLQAPPGARRKATPAAEWPDEDSRAETRTPTWPAPATPERPAVVSRVPPEWDDDDEYGSTTKARVTPPAASLTPPAPPELAPPVRPLEARNYSTPVPRLVVAPFSTAPAPESVSSAPLLAMPPTPHGDAVDLGRMAARNDMGRMAAREATIRRLVWIIALGVAIGVGIFLATL